MAIYTCEICKKEIKNKYSVKYGIKTKNFENCFKCKKLLCGYCAVSYIDESNSSVTKNSNIFCKKCYPFSE